MNQNTVMLLGAAYGALQAVAQFLMLVLPSNTVVWKAAKFLVSGPARPASTPDLGGNG